MSEKKTIFIWKGTKEQAQNICFHAFSEILNLFEIKQVEDLFTKDLVVKMTPIDLKDNSDKMLWLNIFLQYRKEIMKLL